MKRFTVVLAGLLVLPAFAEVAPVYYDEEIEYTDGMFDDEDTVTEEAQSAQNTKQNVAHRTTINRSTATSRAVSSASSSSQRTNSSSRAVSASPRNATSASTRGTSSRTAKTATTVINQKPSTNVSRASVKSRNSTTAKPVTARIGTSNNSIMPGTKNVGYTSQNTLTDSGSSLYNANTARIGIGNRRTTARVSSSLSTATTPIITEEDISSTTSSLTALAELTDYCKAQYAACMDNYCNVLDDNQGRCSCSKNLKNYAKTEAALESATEAFQEAVQKIKYIGLTSAQIESLFAETEAEISMSKNSDSSRLKNSLDSIKKKVIDASSGSSSSAANVTSGIGFDLNGLISADFTSGFDLNAFLGNTGTNASNVSNQRGEQLYKTATNRCKAMVLNSCTAQGIDANVITNSYDLEIDKQCIAYERSLNEANTEMRNNVTNATNILQQARLLLTQNKNSYDLRGCVAAIDSCMQDEYVCGSDYELCLDPSGKYLANGEIVIGGTPGVSGGQYITTDEYDPSTKPNWVSEGMYNLYSTWNYTDNTNSISAMKNAWSFGPNENLGGYIDAAMNDWGKNYTKYKDTTKTDNMALYLLQKIGYIDSEDKVHGMCASVMNQCQDYTFDTNKSTKKYIADNEVVRQYLSSTLAKIKVQQDAILTDYSEDCRSDVQSCLTTNGYDSSNTSSTISKTAVNACTSEITTCMSVGGYQIKDGVKLTLRAMTDWVASVLIDCPVNYYLADDGIGDGKVLGTSTRTTVPVACVPCPRYYVLEPDGRTFKTSGGGQTPNYVITKAYSTSSGGQSSYCSCPEGFTDTEFAYDESKPTKTMHACVISTEAESRLGDYTVTTAIEPDPD